MNPGMVSRSRGESAHPWTSLLILVVVIAAIGVLYATGAFDSILYPQQWVL